MLSESHVSKARHGARPAGFSQVLSYDTRMRLDGESDTAANSLYSYGITYDNAGNVNVVTDSQMGTWGYLYGPLNRLTTASATAGAYSGLTLTENYDVYGNRLGQTASGSYQGSVPQPAPVSFTGNNNRVDQWQYDAAGNALYDGANTYAYDAEERQTATIDSLTGTTGYVYDAEGRRVEKVAISTYGTPQQPYQVEDEYLLGPDGEQLPGIINTPGGAGCLAGGPFKPFVGVPFVGLNGVNLTV